MANISARLKYWIRIHKIAFGVIGGIFLIALFILPKRVSQAIKSPEEKYQTAKAIRRDLVASIDAAGKVKATQQVTLKFQISGKLAWVGVKEGDFVKKYQTLATLDRRELEKKLKKELNDYLEERWDFEQDYVDENVSGQNLERVTISDSVKRLLQKAQFDLDNSVLDVEIADLALELSTLITPINGIVTAIDVPYAGVNITPATATFTVANPEQMEFTADVDEADIALVRLGQEVIINLDAYPQKSFEGQVSQISFAAVSTRGGGTAFPVKISFTNTDSEQFRVGMNGDVEIILESEKDVLAIPPEAITAADGKNQVRLVAGREVKTVDVEIGLETDRWVQITQGLNEGDLVIIGEK